MTNPLKHVSSPSAYDLNDPKELLRLYRECFGYLRTCQRDHHGTDFMGRNFAVLALEQLSAAPTPPQGQADEAMVERVKAGIRGADAEFVDGNLTYDQMLDAMARAALAAIEGEKGNLT